jgi:hypothetical protein
MVLQVQEFLMKLCLLEHVRDLACERTVLSLSYRVQPGSSRSKNCSLGKFPNSQAETEIPVHRSVMRGPARTPRAVHCDVRCSRGAKGIRQRLLFFYLRIDLDRADHPHRVPGTVFPVILKS